MPIGVGMSFDEGYTSSISKTRGGGHGQTCTYEYVTSIGPSPPSSDGMASTSMSIHFRFLLTQMAAFAMSKEGREPFQSAFVYLCSYRLSLCSIVCVNVDICAFACAWLCRLCLLLAMVLDSLSCGLSRGFLCPVSGLAIS
jgi:hypothetical protein